MSEIMDQSVPSSSGSSFTLEHVHGVATGNYKTSIKISEVPRVAVLRSMFAKVELVSVTAEVTQDTLLGDGDDELAAMGHLFIGLIPTSKNADALCGANAPTVLSVPNKQTFPMEKGAQATKTYSFELSGFELDLAQDPRRGAGPVTWVGNSGIVHRGRSARQICTVTWRFVVACSGATVLW